MASPSRLCPLPQTIPWFDRLHYPAGVCSHSDWGWMVSMCVVGSGMSAFSKISMYPSPFSLPSILERQTMPLALMQPHTIIPPPPCLTVDWTQFSLSSSPAIFLTYTLPSLLSRRNLDSLLKITRDHWSTVQSLCDCANCKRDF